MASTAHRKICFITGTRAEFGLMRPVLQAIQAQPRLKLQLVVTGMHLHTTHGRSIDTIREEGWKIDATVPWGRAAQRPVLLAQHTGTAMAGIAAAIGRLKSDVVLVVGDRVEAFAAASAGHIAGTIVAHVHGGDRALGQIDDSLRHAITKLAHIHYPATRRSAARLRRLGEDPQRIILAGSPGIDGSEAAAATSAQLLDRFPQALPGRFALLVLHPADVDDAIEYRRAKLTLAAIRACGIERIVIVYPNNDPGAEGIIRAWRTLKAPQVSAHRNISRTLFLGLMRDAAVMVGNSSAGIIEAATFGTPVIDIGPRQLGRECSRNVVHVGYGKAEIRRAVASIWNKGRPRRFAGANVYGGGGAGERIAAHLAAVELSAHARKIITY